MKIPWFPTEADREREARIKFELYKRQTEWHKFFAILPRPIGGRRAAFLCHIARKRKAAYDGAGFLYAPLSAIVKEKLSGDNRNQDEAKSA